MKPRDYTNFWKWAVVLLVICNVALLVTFWVSGFHKGPEHRQDVRDEVIARLHFSETQVKDYDELIHLHQEAMKALREEGRIYRVGLFAGLKNGDAGKREADSLAKLIGANQQAIEMVTYTHFSRVRELCDVAQKKEFDNIIGEVTRKMNGRPGPTQKEALPPPPGDRPGPPPPGPPPAP